MSEWTGQVLEKGVTFKLSGEEYDYLITTDLLPRIARGKEFIGFYVTVDLLLPLLEEDVELAEDDHEADLLKELVKKLLPLAGKVFFIP